MRISKMKKLLEDFKKGKIGIEKILDEIKKIPYEDIGFAKIDTHREIRKGIPETIFCKGKSIDQIIKIFEGMDKKQHNIIATKANKTVFNEVKKKFPQAKYFEKAKIISIKKNDTKPRKGKILIITAGTSDIPIAEEAGVTAEFMGNHVERVYDVGVAGLHRLFSIKEKIFNAKVIIVIAGMEGALASIVAGITSTPVIAVPTSIGYGASFNGIAPLLTMMNSCAEGIAVVNIDNGYGAGYFASLINR
jgi:NCAIR mutase (PurE)-related protein